MNSYVQVVTGGAAQFTNLTWGHELYCAGHLIQAAVAQHRATGDRELLEVAVRFADLLATTFGPGKRSELDGHPLIEMALVELYRETGATRYLELARHFVEARGHGWAATGPEPRPRSYYSDRLPVRAANTVEGHAVRALYLAAGAADLAAETRDDELLTALQRQWEAMVATKMYVTGGLGSRWDGEAFGDPYELPPAGPTVRPAPLSPASNGPGACFCGPAMRATPTLSSGRCTTPSCRAFLSTAPPTSTSTRSRSGPARTDDEPRNPANGRAGWFGVACCPPNIMRTMSSLGALLATTDDDDGGIQIHQYAASTISADLPAGTANLAVATDYPWDGHVEITGAGRPRAGVEPFAPDTRMVHRRRGPDRRSPPTRGL